MTKNFSIEWLSQSFYDTPIEPGRKVIKNTISGAVEASIPGDVSVEPSMSSEILGLFHVGVEGVTKETSTKAAPKSPTYSSGYTSSSESEAGDDSGELAAHRRLRTKFTSDQICRLEKMFNKHKYLGSTQRKKTAEKLHLSETQVKTWFQNRRMKLKREVQDMRAEYFAPALLSHMAFPQSPSFQHHGQFPNPTPGAYPVHPHQMQRLHVPHFPLRQPVHPTTYASGCY